MEQHNFEDKIKTFIFNLNEDVFRECIRLFNSDGVDTDKFDNDYRLPKIIFTVALQNMTFQYMPINSYDKEEVKKLKRF